MAAPAYGKSEQVTSYNNGIAKQSHRRKPREQWFSFIPNTHEGYVDWERFEQMQRAIAANMLGAEQPGAARCGQALLAGLLRCRRCGHKLTVRYTGSRHDALRYSCWRGFLDNGEPRCIAFGGVSADEAIGMRCCGWYNPQRSRRRFWQVKPKDTNRTRLLQQRELEAAR
jgi:hypothetical protein